METVELYYLLGLFNIYHLLTSADKTLQNMPVHMQKTLLGHTGDTLAIPEFNFSMIVMKK